MTEERKKLIVGMIKELVIQHKRTCVNPDCGISTFLIYENIYRPLLGKKAEKDFRTFM